MKSAWYDGIVLLLMVAATSGIPCFIIYTYLTTK